MPRQVRGPNIICLLRSPRNKGTINGHPSGLLTLVCRREQYGNRISGDYWCQTTSRISSPRLKSGRIWLPIMNFRSNASPSAIPVWLFNAALAICAEYRGKFSKVFLCQSSANSSSTGRRSGRPTSASFTTTGSSCAAIAPRRISMRSTRWTFRAPPSPMSFWSISNTIPSVPALSPGRDAWHAGRRMGLYRPVCRRTGHAQHDGRRNP